MYVNQSVTLNILLTCIHGSWVPAYICRLKAEGKVRYLRGGKVVSVFTFGMY